VSRTDVASTPTCPCQEHTRGWAGYGVDVGRDTGAYCVECSDIAQDYVWPCAAVPTGETPDVARLSGEAFSRAAAAAAPKELTP
jgi:hypothetical protein